MLPDIVMNNMCSGSMQYLSSTRRVYWSFLASVHVMVIAAILHWFCAPPPLPPPQPLCGFCFSAVHCFLSAMNYRCRCSVQELQVRHFLMNISMLFCLSWRFFWGFFSQQVFFFQTTFFFSAGFFLWERWASFH